MSLLRYLRQRSPLVLGLVAMTALLSGLFNAALIAVVNQALHVQTAAAGGEALRVGGRVPMGWLAVTFVGLGLSKLAASTCSQVLLSRFSQQTVAQLRSDLVRTVLEVPLARLEAIGPARITASLSEDVAHVTAGLQGVPALAVNAAQIAGGALYLAWLSPQILLAMGAVLLLGTTVHRRLLRAAFSHLQAARHDQDRLFEMFRGLTEGIKELKLHRPRRTDFENHLALDVGAAYCAHATQAEMHLIGAAAFNNLLFYLLVGGLLFVVPVLAIDARATLSGFVLTCLYLMGPVGALVGSFSYMERAAVALERIEGLQRQMADVRGAERPTAVVAPAEGFACIELRAVQHVHAAAAGDTPFVLGPVDAVFGPGEIVFLVGGNGSGKSTLARVLAGLYAPDEGEVQLDGVPVCDASRDAYRQRFSAVFCDFHLFERLLGLQGSPRLAQVEAWLARLGLQGRVRLQEGRFSTTALSTGQRKRLALLVAWLEDRPFCIFDEWAADQDPQFKRVFYLELLPELKAQGKAVLVISHDDRYFDVADRVLCLREGALETLRQAAVQPAAHLEARRRAQDVARPAQPGRGLEPGAPMPG